MERPVKTSRRMCGRFVRFRCGLRAAILKKAKVPADFEVRGEVMMTRKAFEALNRQAGADRRKDFR